MVLPPELYIDSEVSRLLLGSENIGETCSQLFSRLDLSHLCSSKAVDIQAELIQSLGKPFEIRNLSLYARLSNVMSEEVPGAVCFEDLEDLAARIISVRAFRPAEIIFATDVFFFKINHGFWEKLRYASFPLDDDPLPRRVDRSRNPNIRNRLFSTGFVTALHELYQWHFLLIRSDSDFSSNIYSGFNLGDGQLAHKDFLRKWRKNKSKYTIGSNALHGFNAWCKTMHSLSYPIALYDGSFPKVSSVNNELKSILHSASSVSDEIIFLVPPSLRNVSLKDCDLPSKTILISEESIHFCWAPTLSLLAKYIHSRLSADKRLLIFTQAAAFSALIALFLAKIKYELSQDQGKIIFFDLGQVFNVGLPEQEKVGYWAKRDIAFGEEVFSFNV